MRFASCCRRIKLDPRQRAAHGVKAGAAHRLHYLYKLYCLNPV
jgi:hypothetical protein